jgi:hypothetical protein
MILTNGCQAGLDCMYYPTPPPRLLTPPSRPPRVDLICVLLAVNTVQVITVRR